MRMANLFFASEAASKSRQLANNQAIQSEDYHHFCGRATPPL